MFLSTGQKEIIGCITGLGERRYQGPSGASASHITPAEYLPLAPTVSGYCPAVYCGFGHLSPAVDGLCKGPHPPLPLLVESAGHKCVLWAAGQGSFSPAMASRDLGPCPLALDHAYPSFPDLSAPSVLSTIPSPVSQGLRKEEKEWT